MGCSVVAEWCDVPHSLERDDPVMGAWARHAALHPLPNGQRTLVHRRTLARDTGEGPSGAQAAAWLDVKRHYFQMRPQLGRIYNGIADPTPFADALAVLGFQLFPEPLSIGEGSFCLAALDFGPASVDGWLSRLAAAELGIADRGFLDPEDRTVDLGERRVQLSPLEFGVLATLSERPGRAVTRAELIDRVWGTTLCRGQQRRRCRRAQPPTEARSGGEPRRDRTRRRLPPELANDRAELPRYQLFRPTARL